MRLHIDATDIGTETQWGYRLTYPDGVVEVHECAGSREFAERQVNRHSNPTDDDPSINATVELVHRIVEVGEWHAYEAAQS